MGRSQVTQSIRQRIIGAILLGCLLALLAACDTAYQSGETPAQVADSADEYTAPGGVFTLPLPQGWQVGDFSSGSALLLTFAPSDAERPLLTIYTARLSTSLENDPLIATDEAQSEPNTAFTSAVESYLRADYNDNLTVLDQATMTDGSVRAAGFRDTVSGAVPVNVFIQANGPYFSALEVNVPSDNSFMAALLTLLVNGYAVNPAAEWPVGTVETIPAMPENLLLAAGNLTFGALSTWTGDDGRLHVTGQVANRAPYPVEAVTLTGQLLDGTGRVLEETTGTIPLAVLPDNELSPFELVWAATDLPITMRYQLTGQAQQAGSELNTSVGPEAFDWEDRAEYDEVGQLHIRGTAWNISSSPVYNAQAVVTLFDGMDRVIGMMVADVGDGLFGAGDSVRFDAPVSGEGGAPVRYQLTMTARSQP